jgi:hypothetical protein
MSVERAAGTTFKGNPLTLQGAAVRAGQKAPDFKVLAGDLSTVTLESSKGKTRLFVAVPSLDTPVCDQETRKFNEAVAGARRGANLRHQHGSAFRTRSVLSNGGDQESSGPLRSSRRFFRPCLRRVN